MTTDNLSEVAAAAVEYVTGLPELTAALSVRLEVGAGPAPQTSGQNSATVVGGTEIAFTASLDAAHKTDLLFLMGFVQLQVVQNFGKDPRTDPIGYFESCVTMLQNIGLTIQTLEWSDYNASTQTFELDQAVLEFIAGVVNGPQLELADVAVAALKTSAVAGDPAWTIYYNNSSSDTTGGFAIGVADATTSPNGSVSLQLSTFAFNGTDDPRSFLWTTYDKTSFHLQTASTTLVFNDELWNIPGVGNRITSIMQSHCTNYIENLPPLKPS